MEKIEPYVQRASMHFDSIECIKALSAKVGVRSAYLVAGLLFVALFLVCSDLFGRLICDLLGIIYPGYLSFKAIESKTPDDDKQWLTYWVIFAAQKLLETITDIFLFWIPMYYPIKLIFLIWLAYPDTKGATKIYDSIVRPLLLKHEK
jgi:receptor expression-enhancing protein 5/6